MVRCFEACPHLAQDLARLSAAAIHGDTQRHAATQGVARMLARALARRLLPPVFWQRDFVPSGDRRDRVLVARVLRVERDDLKAYRRVVVDRPATLR